MRNPITAVRRHLGARKTGDEATTAYWAADTGGRWVSEMLEREVDPHQRAKLLGALADYEIEMARQHFGAFGPDPLDDEDGRDMADSLAHSAHLYQLLRQVEWAVATGRPRLADGTPLDHAAGDVLDRMAATPDLTTRMRLLEELYDAVEPMVGGQAAEAVACVPAPGMSGWQLLSEHQYGAGIAAARLAG